MIADLKSCRKEVVLRKKAVKDTRKRWFGAESAASSTVGEATPRKIVRISDVVEVGDVQYIKQHNKLTLSYCSRSFSGPGKGKRRRVPVSPFVAKSIPLMKVHLLVVLHLKLLSRTVLRSGVQEEVAIVAMPQFSRGI